MKKTIWKSGICILIVSNLASCTFSKNHQKTSSGINNFPPSEQETNELKQVISWPAMTKEPNQNKKWWLQFYWAQIYLKDKTHTENACLLLEGLTQDKAFPLNSYAGLVLKSNCPAKSNFENSLSENQKIAYKRHLRELELADAVLENNQEKRFVALLEINSEEKNRLLRKETYLKLLTEAKRTKHSHLENLVSYELKKEFPQYLDDSIKNYYEMSLDLIRDRSFADAIKKLNKLISEKSIKPELKFKSFNTIYRIHKSIQNKKDQWHLIERLGKWIKTQHKNSSYDSWLNEWVILKARWLWTEDQTRAAISTLEDYIKTAATKNLKEEASYTLGRIYDEKKNYDKSKSLYQQSHEQSSLKNSKMIKSKNTIYEKNLWSLAWLEYKNGRFESAKNSLQEIVDKLDGESDSKYLYWLAQSYLKLGKEEDHKKRLLDLRKKEPLSFYSLLSYRDLKQPIPLLKPSSLSNKREFLVENLKNTLTEKENLEILWLISLEQNNTLQGWAKLLEKESRDNYLPVLLLYSQSGQYQNLLNSIQTLTSEHKNTLTYNFPELLFPKPYFDEVQKNSQLRSVPMSFIYSIMRQESAFNPFARSSVDAIGLLQLMPNLARRLSVGEAITYRNEFDLFNPEINIFLGTKELKNLLNTHQNHYIPTIAGYNASSAAYRGWIQVRNRDDVLEFIEEIPYEETRTYIKLILRNMLFYERIYFQNSAFDFPEAWLEK